MPTILEEIKAETERLQNAKTEEYNAFSAAVAHWDDFLLTIGPNLGVVAYTRNGGYLVYDIDLYFRDPRKPDAHQHKAILRIWPYRSAFLPPSGNRVRTGPAGDAWVNLTNALTVEAAEAVMRTALTQYIKDEAQRLATE